MQRLDFEIARSLGLTRAWFAVGYREGTPLERILILPSWCVATLLFNAAYAICRWRRR